MEMKICRILQKKKKVNIKMKMKMKKKIITVVKLMIKIKTIPMRTRINNILVESKRFLVSIQVVKKKLMSIKLI
jgi:hypothetical protein